MWDLVTSEWYPTAAIPTAETNIRDFVADVLQPLCGLLHDGPDSAAV